MEAKKITCIICPVGCEIAVELAPDGPPRVNGNQCKRGYEYAVSEAVDPRRVLTTTVRVRNGRLPVVPVRTSVPVPKNRLSDLMAALAGIVVTAPIKKGQVIVADIGGLGADLIASRDLSESPSFAHRE